MAQRLRRDDPDVGVAPPYSSVVRLTSALHRSKEESQMSEERDPARS